MATENAIKYSGTITDRWGGKLFQAKVFLSDSAGKPVSHNGNQIATMSDENGKWELNVPDSLVPAPNTKINSPAFITARYSGEQEVLQINREDLEPNFIIGAKVQEEEEVVVTGCKTFKCKAKRSWNKHKKAYVGGIIGLVILALLLTIFLMRKKQN